MASGPTRLLWSARRHDDCWDGLGWTGKGWVGYRCWVYHIHISLAQVSNEFCSLYLVSHPGSPCEVPQAGGEKLTLVDLMYGSPGLNSAETTPIGMRLPVISPCWSGHGGVANRRGRRDVARRPTQAAIGATFRHAEAFYSLPTSTLSTSTRLTHPSALADQGQDVLASVTTCTCGYPHGRG